MSYNKAGGLEKGDILKCTPESLACPQFSRCTLVPHLESRNLCLEVLHYCQPLRSVHISLAPAQRLLVLFFLPTSPKPRANRHLQTEIS